MEAREVLRRVRVALDARRVDAPTLVGREVRDDVLDEVREVRLFGR